MKKSQFKYSLLAIGVATIMGLSTGSNAATESGAASNSGASISNKATATYSIGTVTQPVVESNTVIVNVTETANFSLVAINGTSSTDDKNENITTTPGNGATFNHILTNNGNVSDTYTINTTSNNDATIDTATPTSGYTLGTAGTNGITYTILKADGTAAVAADLPSGQSPTGNLSNGGTLKLPPKFKATLSYTVTTPVERLGGDITVGTLTATSTFITTATTTPKVPTLVNENQIIVRLPTFKIAKTATSNVDLSVTNPQIDYNITVTNVDTAYSAIADNFVIRDVLPVGMTLTGNVTVSGASGASVTSSGRTTDNRQIIDIAVPSLAIGADQVVSFRVNVAKASYTGPNASATNNIAVYDKFVGAVSPLPVTPVVDTNYDILDSTVTADDRTRVPATADQSGGIGVDTAATTTFVNRSIVLNNPTIREIAPTSATAGQVTHQTNIVSNGQDLEGTNANPLTFTITDGGNNGAVAPTGPVTITYTPPSGTAGTPITLTATNGVYTINSTTLPGGIAKGGTVAINYNMTSANAVIGSSETSIVRLTAGGNGAPTVPAVTDTTNVKGLTLLKQLALQVDCTGTIGAYEGELGTNSTATFDSKPGDCIYYKITANNTFTTTSLTNVIVSDSTSQWKDANGRVQAIYQNNATGSAGSSNTGLTGTGDAQKVSTTFATLAGGASGTLIFSTKVSP
jgi:hypothetical protein